MKALRSLFLIGFVLLIFVGAALAVEKEMSGEVTAVDVAKGTLTLKSGTVEAGFDCEAGSLIKDVKVGDKITVQYKEESGKKKAIKLWATPTQKKTTGGY
ncbi:MAG TPA: hypothetical protein VL087_04845 [Nitrospirota bacterium]|nr:hypothetical protein [Nitrospirota bacterium]